MSNEATTPAVPRPASTVLIVRDDPFEVLLVLRSAGSDFFPASYVFPGGRVEEHDASPLWIPHVEYSEDIDDTERAFRIAAVRETHEEAGILMADGLVPGLTDGRPDGSSGQVVEVPPPAPNAAAFQELVASLGAKLLLDEVVPWAHWITPEVAPKRFDTRFYLTRAPEGQLAQADAAETDEALWISPAEAVARAEQGSLALPPPTYMNLVLLARSANAAEAIAQAKERPIFPIIPAMAKSEDGQSRLRIPLEAGYGIEEYDLPEYSTAAESRPRPPR